MSSASSPRCSSARATEWSTISSSDSGFVSDFTSQGTRDETAFVCVPTALKLVRGLGAERIRAYCRDLVGRAAQSGEHGPDHSACAGEPIHGLVGRGCPADEEKDLT